MIWALAALALLFPMWASAQTISVSPSTVVSGTPVTATWSGIPSPVATDWIGMYTPSAANTSFLGNWVYVNCTQVATIPASSGNCSISTTGITAGTYQLRLLINDGFTSIATSSNFTVTSSSASGDRYATQGGLTTGDCLTSGTACTVSRMLTVIACGETGILLNGNYTGASSMLNTHPSGGTVPTNKTCTSGAQVTIQAETDGGVFINGQFIRGPFNVYQLTYWNFEGFDVGNSGPDDNPMWVNANSHISIKRVCASNNVDTGVPEANGVVFVSRTNTDSLFEDICAFGFGRLTFYTSDINITGSGPAHLPHTGNTFRRMWIRWEGADEDDTAAMGEPEYYNQSPTISGNDRYENLIWVWSSEQTPTGTATAGGVGRQGSVGSFPDAKNGWILYGYDNGIPFRQGGWWGEEQDNGGGFAANIVDAFIDGRRSANRTFNLLCTLAQSSSCSQNSADRLTSIRHAGATPARFSWENVTNTNECTSLANCPNFYTGASQGGSGVGARNCFEYQDGTLTSTKLWPWRMDNRITAALARANAAGTGGTQLDGTAGPGYLAHTVTSEIVSRYGDVPTACLRESAFVPNFPIASPDFPSVSVRDDFDRIDAGTLGSGWTELESNVFSIASNRAAAPSAGVARALYSDTKMQNSHEVYGTWQTLPAPGGYADFLIFAASDLTLNSQYRVRVNRTTGSNTTVEVRRVDSGGGQTVVMSGVDLGIEAVSGNSFGVRVSGTTISVYWKWTDDVWYRIGQFTDSNLPLTGGVYGGIAGQNAVIDNYGAGPFVVDPPQSPPTPPSSSGSGRFGTTFPGVR